ncbi:hypothetical protein [Clostridium grantii]|uniref:Uncharacterized protein n=1 Tax=Clostridium grantii DSM 8605 TaxID=1121316 RepID=A0A1M5Y4H4_9CLOT|nr:hypothetical protein [Clostridium grantii]SHI06970.1 hypothetical protein SAMN02745207_04189 [Clostridium grantii DSM 8605]
MKIVQENCTRCTLYKNNECDGNVIDCMCKNCPRNLGQCLITRYCRETESVLYEEEY